MHWLGAFLVRILKVAGKPEVGWPIPTFERVATGQSALCAKSASCAKRVIVKTVLFERTPRVHLYGDADLGPREATLAHLKG